MLAVFFAMASMMFTMTLYAGAFYAAESGDHALGPLASLCRWLALAFAAPVLFLLGWPLATSGLGSRWTGPALGSVNLLIGIGVLAAYGLSLVNTLRGQGEIYVETATMTLVLVTLGRYLDAQARRRATSSIRDLLTIDSEVARRLTPAGTETAVQQITAKEIRPGDRLRVLVGERVPADGTIDEGHGALDEAVLTGEAEPRAVEPGDRIHAGSLLVDGCVDFLVDRALGDRVLDRMVELVSSASDRRMPLEQLGESIARWFLPFTLTLALGTVFYWAPRQGLEPALLHALAVLLVACPCALGIAAPLATWVAIGRAAQQGILVSGGEVFERLARPTKIFLDKTGTLTTATLEVARVVTIPGRSEREILQAALALSELSRHPIADAVRRRCAGLDLQPESLVDSKTWPGLGVSGVSSQGLLAMGSRKFLGSLWRAEVPQLSDPVSAFVGKGTDLLGGFVLEERPRKEAAEVIERLKFLGCDPTVLTGDSVERGAALSKALGIPVEAELLPTEKLERLESAKRNDRTVVMVGDGLNDAPVLAAADVGIALSHGADLSREAAQVVLLEPTHPLLAVPALLQLSLSTVRRVRRSLFWAFAYNSVGMGFAAAGWVHPILASALMIVSSLSVVASSVTADGHHEISGRDPQARERAEKIVSCDEVAKGALAASR